MIIDDLIQEQGFPQGFFTYGENRTELLLTMDKESKKCAKIRESDTFEELNKFNITINKTNINNSILN